VPVTVAVYEPIVVAVRVHVDDWPPATLAGEQDAVRPAGDEAVVSATVPAKPPVD